MTCGHDFFTGFLWRSDAANSVSSPPIMPFTDFYNITLEHIDFMEEYRTWQSYGNSSRSVDRRRRRRESGLRAHKRPPLRAQFFTANKSTFASASLA